MPDHWISCFRHSIDILRCLSNKRLRTNVILLVQMRSSLYPTLLTVLAPFSRPEQNTSYTMRGPIVILYQLIQPTEDIDKGKQREAHAVGGSPACYQVTEDLNGIYSRSELCTRVTMGWGRCCRCFISSSLLLLIVRARKICVLIGYHCLVERCYTPFIHATPRQMIRLPDKETSRSRKSGFFEDSRSFGLTVHEGIRIAPVRQQ